MKKTFIKYGKKYTILTDIKGTEYFIYWKEDFDDIILTEKELKHFLKMIQEARE